MNDAQFRALVEASEVFQAFEKFKQMLTVKLSNLNKLRIYYAQAERYGIEYLEQNPNLTVSEVSLIGSMLSVQIQ